MADMLEPLRSAPLEAPAAAAADDDDDGRELAAAGRRPRRPRDSTRDEEDPARSATPDWLKDAGAALGLRASSVYVNGYTGDALNFPVT